MRNSLHYILLMLLAAAAALVLLWILIVPGLTWPGGSPKSVAIASNGLAFVTDSGRGSTSINTAGTATWVIDTASQKQIALLRGGTSGRVFVSKHGKVFLLGSPLTYVIDSTARPCSFSQVIRFPLTEAAISSTSARSAVELSNEEILVAVDATLYRLDRDNKPLPIRSFDSNILGLAVVNPPTARLYVSTLHHLWIVNPDDLQITGEIPLVQPDVPIEDLEVISDDLLVGSLATRDPVQGDVTRMVLIDPKTNTIIRSLEPTNAHVAGFLRASETKLYVLYSRNRRRDELTLGTTSGGIYFVNVVDLTTFTVTKRIDLPDEPQAPAPVPSSTNRLAKAPDGNVYVVYGYGFVNIFGQDFTPQTGPGLVKIDPQSDDIVGKIPFSVPWSVALNPF